MSELTPCDLIGGNLCLLFLLLLLEQVPNSRHKPRVPVAFGKSCQRFLPAQTSYHLGSVPCEICALREGTAQSPTVGWERTAFGAG